MMMQRVGANSKPQDDASDAAASITASTGASSVGLAMCPLRVQDSEFFWI